MDIGNLLFNTNGRIGQKDFWIGVAIIFVGNLLVNVIPFLGILIWLALIWVGIAVYGKRLHDVGKSAWLHAVPWGVNILLGLIAAIMIGGAIIAAAASGGEDEGFIAILAGSGVAISLILLGNLVWLGYTIWVGLMPSEPGDNAYGPAPVIEGAAQPVQPEPQATDEPS